MSTNHNPEQWIDSTDAEICADDISHGLIAATAVAGGALLGGMAISTIGGLALIAGAIGTLVSEKSSR